MALKFEIKGNIAQIINYTFKIFLVIYLVLLMIEQFWEGSVSFYLNLNYLLIFVVILGILNVFSEQIPMINKKPTKKDYIFIIVLGIAGFFIIKTKTAELGGLSWMLSIIAGILIIMLSLLVLNEN